MTAEELTASMRPREVEEMPRGIQLCEGRPTLAEAACAPHLRSTGESFQELECWAKTISGLGGHQRKTTLGPGTKYQRR